MRSTGNLRREETPDEAVEEVDMWVDPYSARTEMERRTEFVSEGAQTARWLGRLAREGFRVYRDRLLQVTGDVLDALGAWLRQDRPLNSARS